jgi:hypothetical protein
MRRAEGICGFFFMILFSFFAPVLQRSLKAQR